MTKAEAVKILKAFVSYVEDVRTIQYHGSVTFPVEALNIAIDTLNKDLIENDVEHSEHWIKKGMYEYQCGSCGMIVIGDAELDLELYRYCPRCGKKKTHIFMSSETI